MMHNAAAITLPAASTPPAERGTIVLMHTYLLLEKALPCSRGLLSAAP